MSTTPSPPRKGPSALARYGFTMLVGLTIGAVCTVMLLNALKARTDPFPDSLMHVQSWHAKQLARKAAENRCAATDTIPHFKALRTTADDLESAFPELRDDARFVQHAGNMRGALDALLSAPPINCQGVQAAAAKIDESCKGCHQEFRN